MAIPLLVGVARLIARPLARLLGSRTVVIGGTGVVIGGVGTAVLSDKASRIIMLVAVSYVAYVLLRKRE